MNPKGYRPVIERMDSLFDSGRMLLKLAEAAGLAMDEAMHSIHDLDQQVETLTAENTRLKAELAQLGQVS